MKKESRAKILLIISLLIIGLLTLVAVWEGLKYTGLIGPGYKIESCLEDAYEVYLRKYNTQCNSKRGDFEGQSDPEKHLLCILPAEESEDISTRFLEAREACL